MKIMLRKIIVIIISFVTIGMMGSCEDIFNDLAVNPNQSDVNSFYTTLENCNKGILGIYGYISTPRNLGACGFGLMLTRSDEGCSVADMEYQVLIMKSLPLLIIHWFNLFS